VTSLNGVFLVKTTGFSSKWVKNRPWRGRIGGEMPELRLLTGFPSVPVVPATGRGAKPPVAGGFTPNRLASQASVAGPLKIAQRFNAGFIVRQPLKSRRDERTVCRPLRDFLPGIIRHTQP